MAQSAVDVREGVEGERSRVVCVLDGRCFGEDRAGGDDERCAGIERDDDSCGQEGGIDSGVEVEAQVDKGDAAKVGGDERRIGVQDIVHCLQRGVCRLPVDQRDVRVFEALDKLVDGGGRHGGGVNEIIIN